MKILKIFLFLIFITSYELGVTNYGLFARDDNRLVVLSKQIIEAKADADLYPPFEELKDLYFKEKKYNEFIEFISSLSRQKKSLEPFADYYIALSRYSQLRYLEESQNWNEYFSLGELYRKEIKESAQKTITATQAAEPLNIYSRLLLWQFYRDEDRPESEEELNQLMSALEYAKSAADTKPLKAVADRFLAYGEKARSRQVYKIYADKIITADIKDEELKKIAQDFHNEGNLDLSEALYDAYIERAVKAFAGGKRGELIAILKDIAKEFAYKDNFPNDPFYAQKLFTKIEDTAGNDAFDEELLYLRAFNLEKAREFIKAKDYYLDLIARFPQNRYKDEANYKAGLILTYILSDIKGGSAYFEGLAEKQAASSHTVSGLYQLGLLNQWQENLEKAGQYYNKLLTLAGDSFVEAKTSTRERLKEIAEARPIEYNLKTFLDVCLKEENKAFDMAKLNLRSSQYTPIRNTGITITAAAYTMPSGCMQPELQYVWSGDLGSAKAQEFLLEPSLQAAYTQEGTKTINLVVVSPSGIVDRSLDFVDIR